MHQPISDEERARRIAMRARQMNSAESTIRMMILMFPWRGRYVGPPAPEPKPDWRKEGF